MRGPILGPSPGNTYHSTRYITKSPNTISPNENPNKANRGDFRLNVPRHRGSKEREDKASQASDPDSNSVTGGSTSGL